MVKWKSHLFFQRANKISLIISLPFMRELMLEGLIKLPKMASLESGRTGLEMQVHPTLEPIVLPPGGSGRAGGRMNKLSREQDTPELQRTPGPSHFPHPEHDAPLGQPSLTFCNTAIVLINQDPTLILPAPRTAASPCGIDHLPQLCRPCCPPHLPGMCRQVWT